MKVLGYHLEVRMSEAEMLYFHAKLQDAEIKCVANSKYHGNVFVFV